MSIGIEIHRASVITSDMENKLWMLGIHSPKMLLNAFFSIMAFAWNTRACRSTFKGGTDSGTGGAIAPPLLRAWGHSPTTLHHSF